MSIVINDHPGNFFSAHDDLLFVAYEATKANDATTYPDYKYVADIYVDGVIVTRVKKDPNPVSKRGIFEIGTTVRSYLAATFNPASSFVAQQLGLDEFFTRVQVRFGEEYAGTLYTDRTVDVDRYYFNHYNGRLLGTRTALAAKVGLGLTNRPYSNKVRLNSGRSFIPYLPDETPVPIEIKTYNHANALVTTKNFNITPDGPAAVSVAWEQIHNNGVDVNIVVYKNGVFLMDWGDTGSGNLAFQDGDILKVQMTTDSGLPWPGSGTPFANMTITEDGEVIYNQITTVQGGGGLHVLYEAEFAVQNKAYSILITGDNTTVPTTDIVDTTSTDYVPAGYSLQILDVCPARLNTLYPGLITDYNKFYTVQIGSSSIYKFDLTCDPRYSNNTIHFLNQYGGFESFDFSKVSRKTIDLDKKDFGKLGYTVSDAGTVSYKNVNGVYNEQKSVYSSQFTERLTINTDILSDEEYTWLGELIISPMVFIERDGFMFPVTVISSNYEYRKQINDKLTNLSITIDFGATKNGQYR